MVIPTFPDSWSLESVMLTIEDIQEESAKWGTKIPDIRVVLNKYRLDRNASKDAWDTIMKEFGSYVLPFQIKESADLQNSINDGKSIYEIRSPKIIRESIAMLGDLVCPLTTQATQKIQ